MMLKFLKYSALFSAGAISSLSFYYLHKCFKNRGDRIYKFIRLDGVLCQECFNKRTPNLCGNKTCSYELLRSIIKKLDEAECSIDICNPCIELPDLVSSLVLALKRKVQVRIIVDELFHSPAAEIHFLSAGIPVKTLGNSKESLMHNKFIIIDRKIVIRGSINYSLPALKGNCENLQFISDSSKVAWYCEYFEDLLDYTGFMHSKR